MSQQIRHTVRVYDVICPIGNGYKNIFVLINTKCKLMNKGNTLFIVETRFFYISYCSLGLVE